MPAVIVDSSVLITLAASEQFHLLREFYSTIHIPPEVWNETTDTPKPFGVQEVLQAKAEGKSPALRPLLELLATSTHFG